MDKLTWDEVFNSLQEGNNSWYDMTPDKIKEILEEKFHPPINK